MYGVTREYERVADRHRVEVVHLPLLFLLSRDDDGEGIGNDNDNSKDNDNDKDE